MYHKIKHAMKLQNIVVEENGGVFYDSGQQTRWCLLKSCRKFPKGNEMQEENKQDILGQRMYAYGNLKHVKTCRPILSSKSKT